MSLLDGMMENKKKFFIQVGIIGVCLVGGVIAYTVLSSNAPARSPADEAAEQRVEEITSSMKESASQEPEAPEIQRSPTRGRIPQPGGK